MGLSAGNYDTILMDLELNQTFATFPLVFGEGYKIYKLIY